jgi:hypothetical protein
MEAGWSWLNASTMPETHEHLQQAQHNQALIQQLSGTPYQDWVVTVAFYTAAHLIEAWLATKNLHPLGHVVRLQYIRDWWGREPALQSVFRPYRELQTQSEKARYQCLPFSENDVRNLILPLVTEVESEILPLLS